MRNMKKFLALVLAMLMVSSMAVMTVGAADDADYTDAAQSLATLGIMKGNEKGDLMLDNGVTRYQTSLFFVQALTGETDAAVWGAEKKSANFADVIDYGTAIDYAYGVGVVKGRGNGVFGYNDAIIYQDMIVMAVRALGYETADMSYPYGHILAAQKLGLTDNIDLVNYKAELKRGETAQLIWNMLQTDLAVTDPITGEILYPTETGLTDTIVNAGKEEDEKVDVVDRVKLIEKAGFSNATVSGTVTAFKPADEDDEDSVDTVNVLTNDGAVTLAAADLGITADTRKATYLGLSVELFVNYANDDAKKAGLTTEAYEDGDATVVFADFAEYTVVANTGDAANIKYVPHGTDSAKDYVSLGGVKFTNKNYEGELYIWDDTNGWERQIKTADSNPWAALMASYLYDTKEDEYANDNGTQYGEIAYRVIAVEDDKDIVEMLYTPYQFGQYIERDLTWGVTSDEETFTLVGKYTANAVTNLDDETTNFKETFLGNNQSPNTAKVSKSKGELSLNVTVEGEDIKSGDFMFYAYNECDNVLTVAKNVGTIETGRLTATNASKGYKINGEYLAPAAVLGSDAMLDNADIDGDYLEKLEAGKDNVKYLAVNDTVVYMVPYAGEEDATAYNFAVISTDAELMAELLDTTTTKYAKALTGVAVDDNDAALNDGLYIDDGYVVVAMLDLATGEWKLANIEGVSLAYDATEEEFDTAIDVATLAKYLEITTSISGKADYVDAANLINNTALVTVVEAEDDVYTIAALNNTLIDSYTTDGLTFSAKGATNAIKAESDADVKAASVTTTEDTVIVAVNGKNVGVRTGVQNAKANVGGNATYYAAGADLIVLTTTTLDVVDWGEKSILAANENYYILTANVNYEYESTDEEDVYALSIEGLYDLKNYEMADGVVATGTKTEIDAVKTLLNKGVGTVLKLTEDGELVEGTTVVAALEALYAEDELKEATITAFNDDQFIAIDEIVEADGLTPLSAIVVNVATADLTDIDWTEMDLSTMYVDTTVTKEYDGVSVDTFVDGSDVEYYAYAINLDTDVAELTEPEAEVLDNFVIDMAGEDIVVLDKDGDATTITVEISAVAAYDKETDTVTVNVVKTVK